MSPIDYRAYHPQWKEIRRQILDQADDTCEFCGLQNGAIGFRATNGTFEEAYGTGEAQYLEGLKPVRIVLTVAHLNHDITDNDPANLRALCQKCHLNWDKDLHAVNAARTRRQRRIEQGQAVLL